MCYWGCDCEKCTGPWIDYVVIYHEPNHGGRPFMNRRIDIRASSRTQAIMKAHYGTGYPTAYLSIQKQPRKRKEGR